jgi:DNA uptake protein ComE-like DNA-binding protein
MSERFVDVLKHEVAEEKAGALGRTGRRLEHALERFQDHETSHPNRADAKRDRLLWDLVERAEAFVVQREACGLRESRQVLKYYGVPREVIARIGARRPKS